VSTTISTDNYFSNMCASYDGRYIYCFSANQIRAANDAANGAGKIKIDTESWTVVDRKDGSYTRTTNNANGRAPYCHSWNIPGKFGFDNDPTLDMTGGHNVIDTPRPYLYYDGFDPEDIFVQGHRFANAQEAWNEYAIAPEQDWVQPIRIRPINPMCHLITLKNGKKAPYRFDMFFWLGQYFDDPWYVMYRNWGIFSQYILDTPIEKGPTDSLRIEYQFIPPTEPPWMI